jgi:hypothetical protein
VLLLCESCLAQQGAGIAQQGGEPPEKPSFLKSLRGNFAITAGAWMPQSDLSSLGVHPTLGLLAGVRNERNELDLNLAFRFVRTANDYVVWRSDSLYPRHYFFGGYIGLDYTRYFMMEGRWEMGAVIGAGYDGFDIAEQSEDDPGASDYLRPLSIETFNYNLGFRFNYLAGRNLVIGIVPKYNFLRYHNEGGSSMFGNAFSLELSFGNPFWIRQR